MRRQDLTKKLIMTKTNTKTKTMRNTFREQIQRQRQRQWQRQIHWEHLQRAVLVTCNIWDTDYISDNWELDFLTIFVTWQLRVTLDSIRNSCDVFLQTRGTTFFSPSIFWFWQDQDKPKTSLRPDHDTTCEFLWKCFNWMQSAIKNWMTFIVGVDGDKREVSRRLKQEAAALGLH